MRPQPPRELPGAPFFGRGADKVPLRAAGTSGLAEHPVCEQWAPCSPAGTVGKPPQKAIEMEMGPCTQRGGAQAQPQQEGRWETLEGEKDREEGDRGGGGRDMLQQPYCTSGCNAGMGQPGDPFVGVKGI